MENLTREYKQVSIECECAMRIVHASIENLRKEYEISNDRSPISSVTSRIKTFDSTLEKCSRKFDGEMTMKTLREMHDIAGIRIITYFEDDIYAIRDALMHKPEFSIVEEKDYVANPKENGYRSLHLIVSVNVYFRGIAKLVPVEIQIRDKAMDLWASLEHIINYKATDDAPEITAKFKRIADNLAEFDQEAMRLRNDVATEQA